MFSKQWKVKLHKRIVKDDNIGLGLLASLQYPLKMCTRAAAGVSPGSWVHGGWGGSLGVSAPSRGLPSHPLQQVPDQIADAA